MTPNRITQMLSARGYDSVCKAAQCLAQLMGVAKTAWGLAMRGRLNGQEAQTLIGCAEHAIEAMAEVIDGVDQRNAS